MHTSSITTVTTKVVTTTATVDMQQKTRIIAKTSSSPRKGTTKPVIPYAPVLPVEPQNDKSVVKKAIKKYVASENTAGNESNSDSDNEEIVTDCKQKPLHISLFLSIFHRKF